MSQEALAAGVLAVSEEDDLLALALVGQVDRRHRGPGPELGGRVLNRG